MIARKNAQIFQKIWKILKIQRIVLAPRSQFGWKKTLCLRTVFWQISEISKKNRSHGYRSQIFPAKGTPPGFGRALEEQKSSSEKKIFLDSMRRNFFFGVWNLSFWQYFATFDTISNEVLAVCGLSEARETGSLLWWFTWWVPKGFFATFRNNTVLPVHWINAICYWSLG